MTIIYEEKMKTKIGQAIFAIIIVFIISFLSGIFSIRYCLSPKSTVNNTINRRICGLTNQKVLTNIYRILDNKVMTVEENNADALIDGSRDTNVQPKAYSFSYTIKFVEPYEIKSTTLVFKDYGVDRKYIDKWSLEAFYNQQWRTIAEGGFPQTQELVIDRYYRAEKVRVSAHSSKNWIDIYEVELIGRPL